MATFKPGQRVRVVSGLPAFVGREGTVVLIGEGFVCPSTSGKELRCDYRVRLDGDPYPYWAASYNIEPIIDDGTQSRLLVRPERPMAADA